MKILKSTQTVPSDGTDILYSGIILDNVSKNKAIEICNSYINNIVHADIQAYDLMHCTLQFVGCDISKLKDSPLRFIHDNTAIYVDSVGIYYARENGILIPKNIGLNVVESSIPSKYFNNKGNKHITVAICNGALAKDTYKCFQNLDTDTEFSKCWDIEPTELTGTVEFVNTKHKIINEIPDYNKLYDMIRDAEMKGMTYPQKYALDTYILRKFGVDDQTILILNRVGLNKISDITRVLDSNSKKIKSLKGIAAKRYASLVTAINKLLDTSYSITF